VEAGLVAPAEQGVLATHLPRLQAWGATGEPDLILLLITGLGAAADQGVLAQRELVRLVAMAEAPQHHLFQDHPLITQAAAVAAPTAAVQVDWAEVQRLFHKRAAAATEQRLR